MNHYFDLIVKEFYTKIEQSKLFITNHNPSIGYFNESILRGFLQDNLPNWVSVGQGFIMAPSGEISNQIDIIIYDSTFYSPLYKVYDLIVVPSESVISVIEVKTSINKKQLHEVIEKNFLTKSICPDISSRLFIYNPPTFKTTLRNLENFRYEDFENLGKTHLIDSIHGLSKFCITKINATENKFEGVAYSGGKPVYKEDTTKEAVFENFFGSLYYEIERKINSALEDGIDCSSILNLDEKKYTPKGREQYLNFTLFSNIEYGKLLIPKTMSEEKLKRLSKSKEID